jgi:LCP family protein required for cell wall assembly
MQYVDLGRLPQKPKNSRAKKFLKLGIVVLLVSSILYTGYILYWPAMTLLKQIAKQPKAALSLIKNPQGELRSTDGRTNFLLVGIDKRSNIPYTYTIGDGEVKHNGFLTDTIVLGSVDKETKQVAMVSIPRDVWVKVPNFGKIKGAQGKINSIYNLGESNKYPGGGGMGLLKEVVEQSLGIEEIHYTARVDFEGFREGVDALGGIDVDVVKSFDDYRYPIEGKEKTFCKDGADSCRFEHIQFKAGLVHMNGETALKFARSRSGTNGEGSDFARAARQQKVLVAAKDKILRTENLLDPLKINSLFKELGESVETDLDVSALVALYNLSKEIDTSKTNTLVLSNAGDNYLYAAPSNQFGGAYALLPKGNSWSEVHKAVEKLFNHSN